MRSLRKAFALALLILLTSSALPQAVCPPPGPTTDSFTLNSRVDEVWLSFTVRNRLGNAVRNLTLGDFSLSTDGQPVTRITQFYPLDDLPLRLAVLLDVSDSMRAQALAGQWAAAEFLARIIRPGKDEASLAFFSVDTHVLHPGQLPAVGDINDHQVGQTALYDALYEYVQKLATAPGTSPARRVVLALTDGEDNWSRHSLADIIRLAQQADVRIYPVTAHSPRLQFAGDSGLRQLAEATGGRAFVLRRYADLNKTFPLDEEELHSGYVIAFRPPAAACGFHNLRLGLRHRAWRVQARSGYYD